VKDYGSTGPTITTTPVFSPTMSSNTFEAIWQAWNFSDNRQLKNYLSRLFRIDSAYEYFLQMFG
jgi:hypothetical protein